MPGLDGTGPMGMGPMTGGGRGWCNPHGPMYGMGLVRPPMYGGLPYASPYGYGAQMPYGYGAAAPWGAAAQWGPWAPGMGMAPYAHPYAGGSWGPQFGSGWWGRGWGRAGGRGGGFGRGGAWGRGRRWARW
jgi:hypothetical protein